MGRCLLLPFLICLFMGCQSKTQDQPGNEGQPVDSTANATANDPSDDWPGLYKGTVPCADCDGIETSLMLNQDSTYQLQLVYRRSTQPDTVKANGRFRWMPGENTITLDGLLNMPSRYSVGSNMLMQLDMTGQPVTADQAARYMLMKQTTQVITITKQ